MISPYQRNTAEVIHGEWRALVATHHIWPRISGGNWDCRKNPLAWAPVTNPACGWSALNCSWYFNRSRWVTAHASTVGFIFILVSKAPCLPLAPLLFRSCSYALILALRVCITTPPHKREDVAVWVPLVRWLVLSLFSPLSLLRLPIEYPFWLPPPLKFSQWIFMVYLQCNSKNFNPAYM